MKLSATARRGIFLITVSGTAARASLASSSYRSSPVSYSGHSNPTADRHTFQHVMIFSIGLVLLLRRRPNPWTVTMLLTQPIFAVKRQAGMPEQQ
jgi:hypothetical protein